MTKAFSPVPIEDSWTIRLTTRIIPSVRRTVASYETLNQEYAALKSSYVELNKSHQALASSTTQRLADLDTTIEEQTIALNNKDVMLKELSSRFDLVSKALSARTIHSEKYEHFQHLLHHEMLPFANTVNVLANEAEAVTRLKAVDDQLRLLDSMAKFQSKTVVAVSGGFSSGKSSFISSLFTDNKIQLPIGVQPVTAIPTYVFHSEQNRIMGYSKQGGKTEIEPSLYAKLSHEMIQQFDFNLRDLLPFVALQTPLERHNHLAFIDLPGYNPGEQTEATAEDEASASEFMAQAQCVLWVIGLDANGTISRSDIDFLHQHAHNTRLYIVLNKADLKPLSDVQSVLEEVSDTLSLEGITFEGISAYSSAWTKELAYEQKPLNELLDEWNQPKDTYRELIIELDDIFSAYEHAFIQDIEQREDKLSLMKALELDLFELGAFEDEPLDAGFDINQYRKKSKSSTPSRSHLNKSMLGVFRSLLEIDEDKEPGESVDHEVEDSKETSSGTSKSSTKPDSREKRLAKIGAVKQHINDLRTAYDVKERQKQLLQLQGIWKNMRQLLN